MTLARGSAWNAVFGVVLAYGIFFLLRAHFTPPVYTLKFGDYAIVAILGVLSLACLADAFFQGAEMAALGRELRYRRGRRSSGPETVSPTMGFVWPAATKPRKEPKFSLNG